jgi:predicted TIM-barrel fold metal-dependent hydrolase
VPARVAVIEAAFVVGSHRSIGHRGKKKERAMTDRPPLVIDGDGHVIEVNETYERIDPAYRHRRPMYSQASRGNIVRLIDGKVWGPQAEGGFVGVNGNLFPPGGKAIHYRRMGTYNPWARLADMDCDQIDVAVVYPTDELPLTVTPDAGFAAARARAYNDWLHDYCQVCPQRLKGVGIVALQDVAGAIQEMQRAMTRLDMVAIQIGCTVREDTLLSDPRLAPFWAEAERLDVAIAVHGPALPSLFRSYFDINRPDHMLEASHMAHTFAQMLACSNIVTSGVLERFPRLRIAFLEAGAGWVPYWMHRMDEYNEVAPERWAHISAKPSEYIKSGRVFFSCEPGDEFIPLFLEHVGEDAMLFASDYLHFDALFVGEKRGEGEPYPGTVATLLARKDVPDSAKRKILLDNSLNFYRMDRSTLGKRGMAPVRPEPTEARQAVMPGTISARL